MKAVSVAGLAIALTTSALSGPATSQDQPGLRADVVFTDYSPLSTETEVLHRMASPLACRAVDMTLAANHSALADQSIDLSKERFTVYVPSRKPAAGYGLLVFVPPWSGASPPSGWTRALDRAGVIYVSASRSGNEESVLGRRIPLALLALENIRRRYSIDPARVYLGGFSGGSRVAMRMAVNYPDAFEGVLLNAGSDPVGSDVTPMPARAALTRAQDHLRLVFVTGEEDSEPLRIDVDARRSLVRACIFHADGWTVAHKNHQVMDGAHLARGLAALEAAARPADDQKLQACRAALTADAGRELDRAEALLDAGKRDAARAQIIRTDERFGGLAAPRSIALAEACACRLLPPAK